MYHYAVQLKKPLPTHGVKAKKLIIVACCILHNYLMGIDPNEDPLVEVDVELANQIVSYDNYQAPRSNNEGENLNSTRGMNDAFIDAFMHKYEKGNKVNGTCTSSTYENIMNELSILFGKKINKEISKPKTTFWKNITISNYEKMVYENEKVIGEEDKTTVEMKKQGYSTTKKDLTESTNDLDNHIDIKNFEAYDNDNENSNNFSTHNMDLQDPSPTISSDSKKKKSKVNGNKDKNMELNALKDAMHDVAQALRDNNAIMKEQYNHKLPPMLGDEVWTLTKNCDCDTNSLLKIYYTLMKDFDKLRTILECLFKARKEVIMQLTTNA
ncbi:hypothetical protein CR513_56892, partial [Mucuna pruriens]